VALKIKKTAKGVKVMGKKKFKYGKKGFRKMVGIHDESSFDYERARECLLPLEGAKYIESTADYNYGWPFSVFCADGSMHAFTDYGGIFAWATAMARVLVAYDERLQGGHVGTA
jgi:hypothetical protein